MQMQVYLEYPGFPVRSGHAHGQLMVYGDAVVAALLT